MVHIKIKTSVRLYMEIRRQVRESPEVVRVIRCDLQASEKKSFGMIVVALHRSHKAGIISDCVHMLQQSHPVSMWVKP